MRLSEYFSLLHRYRYRVSIQRWPMAGLVGGCAVVNSLLAAWQQFRFGKEIERQAIDPPPIFVVGHWRSGTTLLHELLALDDRFCYPTTLECFVPSHFLVSEILLHPLLHLMLPSRRPMDNMPTGVDLPQEDEFALVAMGAPTPYQRMAFPNLPPRFAQLLDMEGLSAEVEQAFAANLTTFLKSLMLKKQKRLILKSPTHTGRIAWLAQQFPGSRFIHIARNPIEVFLSTLRLWRRLDQVQGFQIPRYSDQELEEMVHRDCQRMYRAYLQGRRQLQPGQLIEIQFEQLTTDAAGVIRSIYRHLELGDSSAMEQRVSASMQGREGFQAAAYQFPAKTARQVMQHWADYAQAFGYDSGSGDQLSTGDQPVVATRHEPQR